VEGCVVDGMTIDREKNQSTWRKVHCEKPAAIIGLHILFQDDMLNLQPHIKCHWSLVCMHLLLWYHFLCVCVCVCVFCLCAEMLCGWTIFWACALLFTTTAMYWLMDEYTWSAFVADYLLVKLSEWWAPIWKVVSCFVCLVCYGLYI